MWYNAAMIDDRQACFVAGDDYLREYGDAAGRFDCAVHACFNRRYHRTGTLWEGRFKAGLVDSEALKRAR